KGSGCSINEHPATITELYPIDAGNSMATIPSSSGSHSQTLARGIRILEILADARVPLTIAQLAERLEVHRSIAYRILRTLEDHHLVARDASGRVHMGVGVAELAQAVQPDL